MFVKMGEKKKLVSLVVFRSMCGGYDIMGYKDVRKYIE